MQQVKIETHGAMLFFCCDYLVPEEESARTQLTPILEETMQEDFSRKRFLEFPPLHFNPRVQWTIHYFEIQDRKYKIKMAHFL